LRNLRGVVNTLKTEIESWVDLRIEERFLCRNSNNIISSQLNSEAFKDNNLFKSAKSGDENIENFLSINISDLKSNLFFETESHLTWIDSVIDMLQRRK